MKGRRELFPKSGLNSQARTSTERSCIPDRSLAALEVELLRVWASTESFPVCDIFCLVLSDSPVVKGGTP